MKDRLLTVPEVADLLAVRVSWVYQAVEHGLLPSRRVGRYRRFVRSEIQEWLELQRGPETAAANPKTS